MHFCAWIIVANSLKEFWSNRRCHMAPPHCQLKEWRRALHATSLYCCCSSPFYWTWLLLSSPAYPHQCWPILSRVTSSTCDTVRSPRQWIQPTQGGCMPSQRCVSCWCIVRLTWTGLLVSVYNTPTVMSWNLFSLHYACLFLSCLFFSCLVLSCLVLCLVSWRTYYLSTKRVSHSNWKSVTLWLERNPHLQYGHPSTAGFFCCC